MHSAKSDNEFQQISLNALGLICGLMGGGLGCLYVLTLVGHIYSGIELLIPIPHNPDTKLTLIFYLCLYSIWLLLIWWFARKVGLIFWALAMFPVPSILIGYLFATDL